MAKRKRMARARQPLPSLNLGAAFTVPQCASYLGFTVCKLRRLIAARKIRVLKPGSQKLVIYQAWADEFLARHTVTPVVTTEEVREAIRSTFSADSRRSGVSDLPGANRFPSAKSAKAS